MTCSLMGCQSGRLTKGHTEPPTCATGGNRVELLNSGSTRFNKAGKYEGRKEPTEWVFTRLEAIPEPRGCPGKNGNAGQHNRSKELDATLHAPQLLDHILIQRT